MSLKYPLTETAKATARELAKAWTAGQVPQLIPMFEIRNDGGVWDTGFKRKIEAELDAPHTSILLELAEFNLVRVIPIENQSESVFEVLLLQELKNAVENDFEVSDYFITMNAVGNIIVNSTTGPVQGVGYNTGILHQNVEQLADFMNATLGDAFLQSQTELKNAIDALRESNEANQQSKLGKVVSELGNCLQHGANTAAVVAALTAAAPFIQQLLGG
ncbi:hypothetical protein G4Y79_01435 [Phototrophicus methaneseepsis]|uniref:AbiTii domain-containing protein n=1 Tax=Phototrophicus methaneseepsis TaxID=2710758 RepID=A0A7S8IEZ7_9CHLR|nr:hypothetical protein [Phototrophicus methaneseepsis]QPC83067.1 hypothetical protein G4Y79_01435 [Phototrophicus methaneseepsis]